MAAGSPIRSPFRQLYIRQQCLRSVHGIQSKEPSRRILASGSFLRVHTHLAPLKPSTLVEPVLLFDSNPSPLVIWKEECGVPFVFGTTRSKGTLHTVLPSNNGHLHISKGSIKYRPCLQISLPNVLFFRAGIRVTPDSLSPESMGFSWNGIFEGLLIWDTIGLGFLVPCHSWTR